MTPQHLCIVTEYPRGGTLLDFVMKKRGLDENEARWFFQQLIIGLDCCHQMGMKVTRIKPDALLLDDGQRHLKFSPLEWDTYLEVSSFSAVTLSFSLTFHSPQLDSFINRVVEKVDDYTAPEIIKGDILEDYDPKVCVFDCLTSKK